MLQLDVHSIKTGQSHGGFLQSRHHIATAAIFLLGGQTFLPTKLSARQTESIDDEWPDVLLLVDAGIVVIKEYRADGGFSGSGRLCFIHAGDDCLLLFTSEMLARLTERSASVDDPFYFAKYMNRDYTATVVDFVLTRPPAGRFPLGG